MEIKIDDLNGPEIAGFLEQHSMDMNRVSPPESNHHLDLEGLKKPGITFWTVWDQEALIGCGALKQLDATHAEIKSMRTAESSRGQGIASYLLQYLIDEAKKRNYQRLSLETGAMDFFEPARSLYARFGFKPTQPFADYEEDPNSVFMTLEL